MAKLRVTNWNTLPPSVREKIVKVLIHINVITSWEDIVTVNPHESDYVSDCNFEYCTKIGTCDNFKEDSDEYNNCIANVTTEHENCLKENQQ